MCQGLFIGAIYRLVHLILPTVLKIEIISIIIWQRRKWNLGEIFLNPSKSMTLILMSFTSLGLRPFILMYFLNKPHNNPMETKFQRG